MVLALVLIGILAGFSYKPLKNQLQRLRFERSVDEIKRILQLARSRAIANPQVHCGVHFDAGARPQRITAFLDGDSPSSYVYDPGADEAYANPFLLAADLELAVVPGYPDAVFFRGDGTAFESGKWMVSHAGRKDTLTVLASTGNITVRITR